MRTFWSPFKLRNSSVGMKIIMTFFNFTMLIGLIVNLAIFYQHTRFRLTDIAVYYRGSEEQLIAPQSLQALLETTHFHIFSMPVVIMIMAHLLLMTSARAWLKVTVIGASFLGVILEIAAPWLIRYMSSQCALLMIIAQLLLALSLALYIIIPTHEMWFKKRNAEVEETPVHPNTIRRTS